VTWWNFYFQVHPGAIRTEQAIAFLIALLRHIPTDLLIVWDGLRVHRSAAVRDFVSKQQGRIHLEYLPSYAPELNPVEYLWGYWKKTAMANFCPQSLAQLSDRARSSLRRLRRRQILITAFWSQAHLF
jgi:transposase